MIVSHFDLLFFQQYHDEIEKGISNIENCNKDLMGRVVRQIQDLVRIVFLAVVRFYRLELKPQDLRKDVVINLVTSIVMKD